MKYRKFGNIGTDVSALGFGCMRFPMVDTVNGNIVDQEETEKMIRKAYESGVNYFDTAVMYNNSLSEAALGRAVKPFRDKVMLATKCPGSQVKAPGDMRRVLERSLTKMGTDHIDCYLFHGIGWDHFNDVQTQGQWIEDAMKAKEEGLIRHIGFSFHDKVDNMIKLIDTGYFELVLCQYNLLDRSNEIGMKYAHDKGLGVVVMGPLAGGRIAGLPDEIAKSLGMNVKSTVELALKFVLSNPSVSCAISGMGSVKMVTQNVKVASARADLTLEELDGVNKMMIENKKLAELYCTGCNYCLPCPQGVNIPHIFRLMNYHKVYGITDYARKSYSEIGRSKKSPGNRADACNKCGECEAKCPQKLDIRKQLVESGEALS